MSLYPLSFTAGALLVEESRQVAAALLETGSPSQARALLESNGSLQSRTRSSGRRIVSELIFRLSPLDPAELALIVNGDADSVRQLLWINNCMRYPLIREFAEGPLAEARSHPGAIISNNDIEAFIWSRSQVQPELAETTSSTRAKLRQVIGLMLSQGGLVNANKELLRGAISQEIAWVFSANPEALSWMGGLRLL